MLKVGIAYANAGPLVTPGYAAALAEAAEEFGVESVWTVEHVVIPVGYKSVYPYSKAGKMPGGEDVPIADPLVFLSWLAARTSSVNLATGILILPQRNPLIVAKEAATIDILSGGRLILGIGVGWLREEFEALGQSFENRGSRTDEYIAVLRKLWQEDVTEFDGEFIQFRAVKSRPRPVNGRIPVVIGGQSEAAAKRAARLGDGFLPGNNHRRLIDVMRREAESLGRDPSEIEVTVSLRATDKNAIEWAIAIGADRVLFNPPAYTPDQIGPAIEELMKSTEC